MNVDVNNRAQESEQKFDLKLNSEDVVAGIAYIVETRKHPNLVFVIENALTCLPPAWQIWLFNGEDNCLIAAELEERHQRVVAKQLSVPIKSKHDYAALLLTDSFWQELPAEHLLSLQTDSWINPHRKHLLNYCYGYDYVAAPWPHQLQVARPYIPGIGGGGGICYSKRSARLKVLRESRFPHHSGEPHFQPLSADIWFSQAMARLNMSMPSPSIAKQIMVQGVYSDRPFAVHRPWKYLGEQHYQQLCINMKGLAKLKKGCDDWSAKQALVSPATDSKYGRFLLSYAREQIKQQNFYQADLAIQVSIHRGLNLHKAYNLQGIIAHQLQLPVHAAQYFERALTEKPNFVKARDNLKSILALSALPVNTEEKYMLIHSWGAGFGADILFLLGQLLLAELAGRVPVIYWGQNSLYSDSKNEDVFSKIFSPVNNGHVDDLLKYQKDVYPSHWQSMTLKRFERKTKTRHPKTGIKKQITGIYYLSRQEKLVVAGENTSILMLQPWLLPNSEYKGLSVANTYRMLVVKYLSPLPWLVSKAQCFSQDKFVGGRYLAIHLRGSDKSQEKQSADLDDINKNLLARLEAYPEALPIFLMTDDLRILADMQRRFGHRLITTNVSRTDTTNTGIHHRENNKLDLAHEVMFEVLVAKGAVHFFGCGFSYLACLCTYFRSQDSGNTLLPFDVMTRFIDIPLLPKS